jgi:hypothetical protein
MRELPSSLRLIEGLAVAVMPEGVAREELATLRRDYVVVRGS